MFIQFLTYYSDWAYLALRLVIGLIFLAHGWPKLKSLKTNANHFEAMGFKTGQFWGTIVALIETIGGVALIIGLYAQVAAVLIVVDMLVASIWKIRRGQGLVGGYELDLILLLVTLLFATIGAGVYSLDFYWFFGY